MHDVQVLYVVPAARPSAAEHRAARPSTQRGVRACGLHIRPKKIFQAAVPPLPSFRSADDAQRIADVGHLDVVRPRHAAGCRLDRRRQGHGSGVLE